MNNTKFKYRNGILINKREVSSMSEYLDIIETLKDLWENKWLYYRGVSKSEYELTPSIYRQHNNWTYRKKDASEIFSEFKRKVSCFINLNNCSDWRYYELMQHYGLPTRLLDWSCGSLIAVFFSLLRLNSCYNPCIWALDPKWLNSISVKRDYVFSSENADPESKIILSEYLHDLDMTSNLPIAILPTNHNARIVAQKSAFTVHGTLTSSLDEILKKETKTRLCKITLSNKALFKIKRALVSSGINYSNIFPDISGLCDELKYEYHLD